MIKIITEPKIYVVGDQCFDDHEIDSFLEDEGVSQYRIREEYDPEILSEVAGRLCYMSFKKPRPGGSKAYFQHILEEGHGSVLEHAVFNFIVTGVSRSFSHELIRHRAGVSVSQLSQRFVDESDVAFVVPPAMINQWVAWTVVEKAKTDGVEGLDELPEREQAERFNRWVLHRQRNLDEYQGLQTEIVQELAIPEFPAETWSDGQGPESWVELNDAIAKLPNEKRTSIRKRANEAARSVLPNCTETKLFLTMNARALRNILEQRGAAGADAEIRRFAMKLHTILVGLAPNLFGDFSVVEGPNGDYLYTPYHKV